MTANRDDWRQGPPAAPTPQQPPLVRHRPHGSEHPYAATPDQRVPVQPLVGEVARIGVQADPQVVSVVCELIETDLVGACITVELPMLATASHAAQDADRAGDDGHLAEAQSVALDGDGGWMTTTPPLRAGCTYAYRFAATTAAGERHTTDPFLLQPAQWVAQVPAPLSAQLVGVDERLVAGSVEWLVTADAVHRGRFALQLRTGQHVVGFGERFDRLDQRGQRLDAVVFEQYKAQGRHGRTYLPMPFAHVVGEDGTSWGFHVRTARRTWYDVAASDAGRLTIEVDTGALTDATIDVGLWTGTPTSVLTGFLDEAGRAEQLPDWVFRLWASGNEWNTQTLVEQRMASHQDLNIPVGVVVIEAWSDEEGITIWRDAQYRVTEDGAARTAADFIYPPDGAWPDPEKLIRDLHAEDIKVVLWQIPLQKTDPGLGGQAVADARAMVEDGHAVLEADGSAHHNRGWWFPQALLPDLSTQRTRDWWTAKRRYLVADLDVDGFKTDGGEHAWGRDLRYGDGHRGDEGNNLYPMHYARAFGDLLRQHGKAPVTFSRSGFTGSQAHGIYWAGDEDSTWEAFRNSVTAGLTAAACGIVYWGWDLAGFSGPVPDAELYLRATAAAAFMPIMQYHSEFNHHQRPLRDRTPWHIAETTGDDRVIPVFRHFAHLRQRLVPYLSAQAARTVDTDRPLMRPLFFDHPDDPQIWDHPLQYLLGDDLLVHPVTEPGATTWTTYLPEGDWIDVWSGHATPAGTVTTSAPWTTVPVFCRPDRWTTLQSVFDPGEH